MHLTAALLAVVVGGTVLPMRKGTRMHRFGGRVWVVLMMVTALLSFGIRNSGSFSWIHLLSLYTIFAITMALIAISRKNVVLHKQWMRGTYLGLVVAGVFTPLPQRLLGNLVWHAF
jgi:uncharacterized membrane protein